MLYKIKYSLVAGLIFSFAGVALIGSGLQSRPIINHIESSTNLVSSSNIAKALPPSVPTKIVIPSIQVNSDLIHTGLNSDRSPQVPTGEFVDDASWLDTSPTPGQIGTAVILGHVDTLKSGPSVFFHLAEMKPNQHIFVTRQDGQTADFVVYAVRDFSKSDFPSQVVYGNANYPALHLITCGGEWNEAQHTYSDNTVVFAKLNSVHSADQLKQKSLLTLLTPTIPKLLEYK